MVPYDEAEVIAFTLDCLKLTTDVGRIGVNCARMQFDAETLGYAASREKHWRELQAELGVIPPVTGDVHALRGAFCIPKALFGDRLWWPNFLNEPEARQDEMIRQTLLRGYNHGEIQVSGIPYPGYPEIPLDLTLLRRGLQKMKAAKLTTIVAFRDDRGPDLSYLQAVVPQAADLIDWCMGIYEINGVLQSADKVLGVLTQARALLPNAKLAVHFTAQDPGTESYGLVDWARAKADANLNAYFFQVSGWLDGGLVQGQVRIADWTRRLMGGFHGYPILSDGVYDFENTTTKTFRDEWTEAQGVAYTDALMNTPLVPDGSGPGAMSIRPSGFNDGGS
jgi:hypothetical protein